MLAPKHAFCACCMSVGAVLARVHKAAKQQCGAATTTLEPHPVHSELLLPPHWRIQLIPQFDTIPTLSSALTCTHRTYQHM